MPQGDLQGIIVGVANGGFQGVASEIRSQRAPGPIDRLARRGQENVALAEWTTRGLARRQVGRIAKLQTKRGVAWIGLLKHQQVMRLSAHITYAEHGVVSEAVLN